MIHIMPVNDLHPHETSEECLCGPKVFVAGGEPICVHNAWDFREIIEQAEAIINGDFE